VIAWDEGDSVERVGGMKANHPERMKKPGTTAADFGSPPTS
jgi:hypothetical protein